MPIALHSSAGEATAFLQGAASRRPLALPYTYGRHGERPAMPASGPTLHPHGPVGRPASCRGGLFLSAPTNRLVRWRARSVQIRAAHPRNSLRLASLLRHTRLNAETARGFHDSAILRLFLHDPGFYSAIFIVHQAGISNGVNDLARYACHSGHGYPACSPRSMRGFRQKHPDAKAQAHPCESRREKRTYEALQKHALSLSRAMKAVQPTPLRQYGTCMACKLRYGRRQSCRMVL